MNMTPEQLDLVARYLDGENVRLSPELEQMARELSADERSVGAALGVKLPPGALHRVGGLLRFATPVPVRLVARRWFKLSAAAAAVAAAILVTVVFFNAPPPVNQMANRPQTKVTAPVPAVVEASPDSLDILASDFLLYQARLDGDATQLAASGVDEELSHFFLGTDYPVYEETNDSE
jgi:hypothetical protein